MRRLLLAGCAVLALAGCQNLSDPVTAFATVQTTYDAAVTAEIVYIKSGKATKATVDQIEAARLAAWGVIGPIQTEIAAGQAPSNDVVLAAQAAVATLQALVPVTGSN